MEKGLNFIDFKFIMPLGYIKNKQKARRARARKSAMRAHSLNGPMRARTRAHIGLASLRFACARARARASALLACFPHTVKKMPASQHLFPSLLLRKCLLLRKQSFSSFSRCFLYYCEFSLEYEA